MGRPPVEKRPNRLQAHVLTVELVLDRLGGCEGQLLRGRDLDGCAGRGIAALASSALFHLELATPIERDLVATGRRSGNGSKYRIDDLAGIGLDEVRTEKHTSEIQ